MARKKKTETEAAPKKAAKKNTGIKLNDLLVAKSILDKISKMTMPADSALEFAKFYRNVLMAIQAFEKDERRLKLLEKHCVFEENGNVKIKESDVEIFNTEIRKLLDERSDIEPIEISKLSITLTPADLINILSLFK